MVQQDINLKMKTRLMNLRFSNSKLSSNPQLPGDSWLTGEGAKEDAVNKSEINDINPDGVRANINNATNAFSQILKSMPNDPFIVQMQKADIGPII